ncbi:MAG: U32 family peptidase [Actinomycetota bacterium]|nr:U32 family peptidase [Actinomycetota bacterium]MDQ2957563.1 U32 family peptidase [Actinomycetota bacterium]
MTVPARIHRELFADTRAMLREIGVPDADLWQLPSSDRRFDDGGHYRVEIPTVNTIAAAEAVLDEADRLGVRVNRLTETLGLFRHTRHEIEAMVRLCADYGCELVMSPGPRASYDTSASAQSPQGSRLGYRLRGQEQLVRAVEDVRRACDLGVRGIVVYDEGMLWVLAQLRERGALPAELHLKVSAHCGHGNAASAAVLQRLGASSINPVRDLQLPMLAALRSAVDVPLDCHTDNPVSSGGFIRYYEAPEFVRLLAPVYLKTGNSVIDSHGLRTTAEDGRLMAQQAAIVQEILQEHFPEAQQSNSGSHRLIGLDCLDVLTAEPVS